MSTSVTASKLNRRVRIEAPTGTSSGSGGRKKSRSIVADHVPANISYPPASKKGDEIFTQQQLHSALFTTITIRYRPSLNIDASMFVIYGTREFNIRTVQLDDEARKYIILQCEELQATGVMH